jgi:hypothetical protein
MKTKLLITVIVAAPWMLLGQANAEEKELSKSHVPKAVLKAFEKAYPNVKDVEYEQEMFNGNAKMGSGLAKSHRCFFDSYSLTARLTVV